MVVGVNVFDGTCFRPQSEQPSALQALQRRLDLRAILGKSRPVKHDSIISFKHLRREVFSEFEHAEVLAGIKVRPAYTLSVSEHENVAFFLPPANEVCEGYVFTGVCLSTGRGVSAPLHAGIHTHPGTRGRHPPGQTHPPSACWDTINKRAQLIFATTFNRTLNGSGIRCENDVVSALAFAQCE